MEYNIMVLSEKIIIAGISTSISLFIAIIGFVISLIKMKGERKKIILEIKNSYTTALYEKRMELYPYAFELSSKIKKLKPPLYIISHEQQLRILKNLNSWVENKSGIFLSQEVISSYYSLRKELGKNPGNGDGYTETQINNLWTARNNFRSALRQDISNLHKKYKLQ